MVVFMSTAQDWDHFRHFQEVLSPRMENYIENLNFERLYVVQLILQLTVPQY